MTRKINAGEGSLGQLLKDDKLAKSLSATSGNFEQISGRLTRNDNTAGKLLTEKELYDRLNSTVAPPRRPDQEPQCRAGDGRPAAAQQRDV